MGRSVAVPRDAVVTFYFPFDQCDPEDDYDLWGDYWSDMIGEIRIALTQVSDLFETVSKWVGNEMHCIASNGIVNVVLCEYADFCSLSLVPIPEPMDGVWEPVKQVWDDFTAEWATSREDEIAKTLEDFGLQLCRRLGTFSNGESVYERA